MATTQNEVLGSMQGSYNYEVLVKGLVLPLLQYGIVSDFVRYRLGNKFDFVLYSTKDAESNTK